MQQIFGNKFPVMGLAFSPDGTQLATVTDRGKFLLWDCTSGEAALFTGHPRGVGMEYTAPVFSPSGQYVALGTRGYSATATIWERETQKRIHRIDMPETTCHWLGFSQDGKWLLAGTHHISIWKVRKWKAHDHWVTWGAPILHALDHAGRYLVVSGDAGLLSCFGMGTKNEPQTWGAPRAKVRSLAIAPDGSMLACGTLNQLLLHALPSGKRIGKIKRPRGAKILALDITADGRTLAVAEPAGVVRFYDLPDGHERVVYEWPVGDVRAVTFAPDGLRAAIGGSKGDVVVWDVD